MRIFLFLIFLRQLNLLRDSSPHESLQGSQLAGNANFLWLHCNGITFRVDFHSFFQWKSEYFLAAKLHRKIYHFLLKKVSLIFIAFPGEILLKFVSLHFQLRRQITKLNFKTRPNKIKLNETFPSLPKSEHERFPNQGKSFTTDERKGRKFVATPRNDAKRTSARSTLLMSEV